MVHRCLSQSIGHWPRCRTRFEHRALPRSCRKNSIPATLLWPPHPHYFFRKVVSLLVQIIKASHSTPKPLPFSSTRTRFLSLPVYPRSCVCRRLAGGDVSASALYFNTTTAACQNVTTSFRPSAEVVLVESTFTRYSQKEVKTGGALGGRVVNGTQREQTPKEGATPRHSDLNNRVHAVNTPTNQTSIFPDEKNNTISSQSWWHTTCVPSRCCRKR